MASSGSFATTSCEGRSLTFSWSIQSQSIANNTTTIAWNLKGSGSYSGYVICGGFQVIINGSTVCNNSTDYRLNVYNGTVVASGTHTISHNNDGTKSFSASASAGIYYYDRNCFGSGSWSLDAIPRASTITSASNVTLGNKCGITFTPASASFQYNIKFSLGDWSADTGKFNPGTTSAYTYNYYTIPNTEAVLKNIPSSTAANMTATLTTYNSSGAQIGSSNVKTFVVTIPDSVKPTISASNITLSPQTYNYLIQNKNKLTVSVSGCSAGTGSSIKSYTFSGPGISSTTTNTSVTSSTISDTGTITYTVTVTDSRGRTASATKSYTCHAYSAPKITLSAYRVSSSSSTDANSNGTYARCTYNLSYASIDDSNKPTIKIYYKKSAASSWSSTSVSTSSTTSGTSGTVNATGNHTLSSISVNDTYTIYASITDSYGGSTSSIYVTLFGVERILNVRPGGKGIAFGKMASADNVLDSRWPIRSDDPVQSMQNLSYRGIDLISSTSNDTITNWNNQGNLATTFYTKLDQINGQPSQYGFVLNLTTGPGSAEAHQIWTTQPNGDMYHRGGNASGIASSWKAFLDSSNYTNWVAPKPVNLTSSLSTLVGTYGTVTLSQSAENFSYLEIFYQDNATNETRGKIQKSIKVCDPNGKTVELSVIEAHPTNASIIVRTSYYVISGTTITKKNSAYSKISADETYVCTDNVPGYYIPSQYIRITKVLGYK